MTRLDAKKLTHARRLRMHVNRPDQPRGSLWIRTVAGPSIGFGHLRRALTLAGMLEKAAKPHFLVDSQDVWSKSEANARGWGYSNFCSGEIPAGAPVPAAILIDTREEKGLASLISAARKHGIPVTSIHDLGLNPLPSDVVIDGSLSPCVQHGSAVRYYQGTQYMVLDPVYATVHQMPRRVSKEIHTVLVNLGGGDSSRFFPRVLEGLRRWGRELETVGVRGFVSWGQERLESRNWAPMHFRWAGPNQSIAELFHNADLAVTAGGISAFEALCTGTPVMALSYDGDQHRTAEKLAAAGLCIDLGFGDRLDPDLIPPLLTSLQEDRALRQTASREGRRLIDGKGAERVAGIILRLITRDRPQSSEFDYGSSGDHQAKGRKGARQAGMRSAQSRTDAGSKMRKFPNPEARRTTSSIPCFDSRPFCDGDLK